MMRDWLKRKLAGHVNLGRLTIYGFNAMHVAINLHTRWGYFCFHPPMYCFGHWWPWYFYVSPNATPWAASFAIGPGVDRKDWLRSKRHNWNYTYQLITTMWNSCQEDDSNPDDPWTVGFNAAVEHIRDSLLGRISEGE